LLLVPTVPVPITAVPSRKLTVPVGPAASEVPVIFAVRIVVLPACKVDGAAATAIVEGAAVGITITDTLPNVYAA
jgi:hypothetical protein